MAKSRGVYNWVTFDLIFFSRVLRDSAPRLVNPLVRRSVHHTLLFLDFRSLWPHCSCPSDQVTSNMAPAHPHATGVAVYPALLIFNYTRTRAECRYWLQSIVIREHAQNIVKTLLFLSKMYIYIHVYKRTIYTHWLNMMR